MIEFCGVTFGFAGAAPLLEAFSMSLRQGTTAILGPSGSGKTTLIRLISGLLLPNAGSVMIGEGARARVGAVRGVLFQDDTLVPWLTAYQNALFPLRPRPGLPIADRATRAMEAVGLGEATGRLPHELSSGMKKRLEFVRATVSDDQYLIADEPFSGLDFHQKRVLWALWKEAMSDESRTGVLVTQDIGEAVELADRVVVISGDAPVRIILDEDNTVSRLAADREAAIEAALRVSRPASGLLGGGGGGHSV